MPPSSRRFRSQYQYQYQYQSQSQSHCISLRTTALLIGIIAIIIYLIIAWYLLVTPAFTHTDVDGMDQTFIQEDEDDEEEYKYKYTDPSAAITPVPMRASSSSSRCQLITITSDDVRCAPYFMIIGTFKAGTTSLYKYLSYHPGIRLASDDMDHEELITQLGKGTKEAREARTVLTDVRTKETNFFTSLYPRSTSRIGGGHIWNITMYMRVFFPVVREDENVITGEASPSYFYEPHTPGLIARTLPHTKFIILLREPIARAYSRVEHYVGLLCAGLNSTDTAYRPYCTPSGISSLFSQLVSLQLPALHRCLQRHHLDVTGFHQINDHVFAKEYPLFIACMNAHTLRVNTRLALTIEQEATRLAQHLNTSYTLEQAHTQMEAYLRDALCLKHCMEMQVLAHSLYVIQLRNWYLHFPPSHFLIISSENFYRNTTTVMSCVETHLQLDHMSIARWKEIVSVKYNVKKEEKLRSTYTSTETSRISPVETFIHTTPASRDTAKLVAESATMPQAKKIHPHVQQQLEAFFHPYNVYMGNWLGERGKSPWPYQQHKVKEGG